MTHKPYPDHSTMIAEILNEDDVLALLPQVDVPRALRDLFRSLSNGNAVQPAQSITEFPEAKGDFITYLGVLAEAQVFGTKLSPYIVTEGKPVITAWTSLMSMETGQPLLMCDAGQLTTERTAGTTALAVDLLATDDAQTLAIIGSGAIAFAHYRHVKALRPWASVRLYSPSLSTDAARKAEWQSAGDVIFAKTSAECVTGADVVMLCTSSGKPVCSPSDIGRSALITSISTNVANAHEVDPVFLLEADVYCDYKATTPMAAGEMKLAAQDHGWSADAICGDLADLVSQNCLRPNYEKPVFFRSVGLGLEDVAMAHALWLAKSAITGDVK
jgi:L-arginine dehydrogenase